MKKIIYTIAITFGILILVHTFLIVFNDISEFDLFLRGIAGMLLVLFGIYGLVAEMLLKKFRGKDAIAFSIEANYWVRKKGFLGRIFLFPFMKVKSNNSMVIALLGTLTWMVILIIALQVILQIL